MTTALPTFMPKEAFSALSLREKNAYLQEVTADYAKANGLTPPTLDKDALSRLRRFYLRRSFADLKLENLPDDDLNRVLRRMGEQIMGKEFTKGLKRAINAEIPPSSKVNRAPPIDDDQLMFFVPSIYDAPLKDDVNLMDVAPFSLSKTKRDGIIRYELKDCVITIEGGAESGMANAYDYDIFLNMVSYLAEELRRFRAAEKKGLKPSLPSRTYRPTVAQILKFCRRGNGGKQYVEMENALDRLQATRIKIVATDDHSRRREAEAFTLIGRYRAVSHTSTGRLDVVEITIPDWVYDGVVTPDATKPTILTLNPDYFLINKPIARFLYRLARKAAGQTDAWYTLKDIHFRSGAQVPFHKFRHTVELIIEASRRDPLPDYDLELRDGKEGPILYMKRRQAVTDERGQGTFLDVEESF